MSAKIMHGRRTLEAGEGGDVTQGKDIQAMVAELRSLQGETPISVVLLDEVEKAHRDMMEPFFQVIDKGVMDDSEGREIDFKNTIIILTSNIGSSALMTP